MELVKYENNELVVSQDLITILKDFKKKKVEIELQEKQLREELLEAMEKYGILNWSSEDQTIYEGLLQIVRDSGIVDLIPLLFANKDVKVDSFISIVGQFRSRDVSKPDGRLKVQLYVYVKELNVIDSCLYSNDIEITGYVCKKPTLRNTPSGKQIADLLIACNYNKDKTAYIPVITWGREARKSGKYSVGTKVKLDGRI